MRGVSVLLWFFPLAFEEGGMVEGLKGVWTEGEVLELWRWVLEWVGRVKGKVMGYVEKLEVFFLFFSFSFLFF